MTNRKQRTYCSFDRLRFCCINRVVSSNKERKSGDTTRIYPSFLPIKCNSSLHGQVKCCRGLFYSTNGEETIGNGMSSGGKKKLPSLQEKAVNSVQIKSDLVSCADFFHRFLSLMFLFSLELSTFMFTLDAPRRIWFVLKILT